MGHDFVSACLISLDFVRSDALAFPTFSKFAGFSHDTAGRSNREVLR